MTAIEKLLIDAIAAEQAKGEAHAAVFADPKNNSLIPALQEAMVVARNARRAYEAAAGSVFDYRSHISTNLNLKSARDEERAIESR